MQLPSLFGLLAVGGDVPDRSLAPPARPPVDAGAGGGRHAAATAAGGGGYFVVGDVHGCLDELEALLDAAAYDAAVTTLVIACGGTHTPATATAAGAVCVTCHGRT